MLLCAWETPWRVYDVEGVNHSASESGYVQLISLGFFRLILSFISISNIILITFAIKFIKIKPLLRYLLSALPSSKNNSRNT